MMVVVLASLFAPVTTVPPQATATASAAESHYQVTHLVVGLVAACLGWFIKRVIASSDGRYLGLVQEMHDTNVKLAAVAEELASVVGQLRETNRKSDLRD